MSDVNETYITYVTLSTFHFQKIEGLNGRVGKGRIQKNTKKYHEIQ